MKLILSVIIVVTTISACSTQQKVINEVSSNSDTTENQIVNPSFYQEKFLNGIDFYARGNEPNWVLEIDFDNRLTFSEMNEPVLTTSSAEVIDETGDDILIVKAKTANSEFFLTISKAGCQDNMSGEMFDYKVRIQIRKSNEAEFKEFNGCGRYLYDYRLNDIWVMEEMTGVELKKENLAQGLPMFEFYPAEKRFSGHAGCNQIFSEIDVKGNKISFKNIASTKMACPDMKVEQKVLHSLNQNTFTYKIEKMKLTLETESGLKMVFRKVD